MSVLEEEPPAPAGVLFLTARSLLDRVDRLSYCLVAMVMGAMTLIVAVQVLLRYAFASSIDSADELARLFFVWAMFLAVPHGVRQGVHVGMKATISLLPSPVREKVFRLNSFLGAVLVSVVFVAAVPVIAGKWQELMPTLEVTAAVYYIAVLFSAGHACLHLLLLAWGGTRCWEGYQWDEAKEKAQ